MEKNIIIAVLFCIAFILAAQDAYIDYLEGGVFLRDNTGSSREAELDDRVDAGFTVITGEDGYTEIYFNEDLIKLNADTVFQLLDAEEAGEKINVFSCVMGSIYLKIKSLSNDRASLYINTPSATLGVRGTAFTVFSGVDGTSLVAVEQGKVVVASEGIQVNLEEEEGVEIKPGEAPGMKFKVLRGKVDYSKWKEDNKSAFLSDPLAAMNRVEERLEYFIKNIDGLFLNYTENKDKLALERKKLAGIENKEEKKKYYSGEVFPLEVKTSNIYLNIRYYALSALSLRRYVLGSIYVLMKTSYIKKTDSLEYNRFLDAYNRALESFEENIVPRLVDADI